MNIDYSQYSIEDLLDVKRSIKTDSDNYNSFLAEFKNREHEIAAYYEKVETDSFNFTEQNVKVLGYLQLSAGALILVSWVISIIAGLTSIWSSIFVVPIIILNIVAGYTIVKERVDLYWISILNQVLQIPSFSLGAFLVNYSSLGGVYIKLDLLPEVIFGVSAKVSSSFTLDQYTQNLTEQSISINVLAIAFIVILLRVKSSQSTANKAFKRN